MSLIELYRKYGLYPKPKPLPKKKKEAKK